MLNPDGKELEHGLKVESDKTLYRSMVGFKNFSTGSVGVT